MKKVFAVSLALVLLCLLTACGASSADSADIAYNTSASTGSSAPKDELYGAGAADGWNSAESSIAMSPSAEELSAESGASPLENAKIIYTADMSLETKSFEDASGALDGIVEALGGYYESRSLYQGGSYRRLECTIRIPVANFNAFLSQAGQIAHVTNQNEYKDDISEAYYDSEARLATQQTKLERLLALLEQAATMEDIISLETAISETELQIEYLTGSLRKYDSLVNFSTITLSLSEVYRLSTEETPALTFGQRLNNALITGLERGIDGLENFIITFARNWMTLLFLAVIIVVVALLVLRGRKRKHTPPSPPVIPPKDPPKTP